MENEGINWANLPLETIIYTVISIPIIFKSYIFDDRSSVENFCYARFLAKGNV